jgi:hypothetical protein
LTHVSTFFRLVLTFLFDLLFFALIAKLELFINMIHTIVFILAVAAIAPVVAPPPPPQRSDSGDSDISASGYNFIEGSRKHGPLEEEP